MSEHMESAAHRKLAQVERERREHEARVRAGTEAGIRPDAPTTDPEPHQSAVTEEAGARQEPPRGQEPYRPAMTEQVRREQAEVDALLLGTDGSAPPAPGEPGPATPGPAASPAVPDPATRVPFAGERPALHQVPPHQVPPHRVPRERRRGWAAVGGAAATAALLASLGTATVTGAFESPALDQTTTAAPTQVVPASSTSSTPDWQAVTAAVRDSVVALDVVTGRGQGQGSGVVLDTDGTILTNSHVVAGAREVTVTLADGRLYEAELVGQDETTDLAVVRLVDPPADLTPATLGSSADLAVGQAVLAVGNPLGLDSTATTGIISALDRPVVTQSRTESVVTNAIQVDAAVNPGNSGGPLFDARGEVIGITSSIATLSGGQPSGSIGLGFAIPVDQAADVADQLVANGQAQHAFLGVALSDATAEADGVTRAGARVENVEPGSPAADAGLEPGDVITAVDDRPVDSSAALTGYVRQYSAGEEAVLDVVRDGEVHELTAALATREVRA